MSRDNAKTLENGLAKALEMIEDTIVNSLIASLQQMFAELPTKIGYSGFTGQTQTSYMGGVYVYGHLRYIVTEKEWTREPIRRKMPKGARWYLNPAYDGSEKIREGMVDIIDPSGRSLSLDFLRSYKANNRGIAVVVTTGTEYSEWLETVMRLDVLTRTFMDAPKIINSNWKKIDEVPKHPF